MRNAIAPSTRDAYETAIRRFKAFSASRGWREHEAITARRVAEWLSAMGDEGSLTAGTIRAYKSALREFHIAQAGPGWEGPNPCDDAYVIKVLNGIIRARADIAELREPQPAMDNALTPEMVLSVKDRHPADDKHKVMLFAAMALGVCALLRPSEMLGSPQYPERALHRSQLTFHNSDRDDAPSIIPSVNTNVPGHARISLKVSKTDQRRQGKPKIIAAPFAVEALWRW